MKREPFVNIIILNWNGYKDTIECVESLYKINYKNYKIIIVDNGSADESVKILKNKFPQIKLIENEKNIGYAEGNNVGIRFALGNKAEYILLLNNDTVVGSQFLKELVDTAEKKNIIGIVSPIIYYFSKPDIVWSTGRYKNYSGLYPYIDYEYSKKDKGQYASSQAVDGVTGCCILVKRDVFEKIGYLDKDYFLYVEDTDFCIRVKRAGYNIVYNPKAKVWHKVSASSGGEENNTKDYYLNRNLILFARKNLRGIEKLNYYTFLLLGRIILLLVFIKKRKFKRLKPSILGLSHGFLNKRGYYSI